ncbi:MAG: hypothetical protein IJI43_00825 [Bacilli bacterium]|nr:hypothetical protein [Bacilli bacterium]
MGKFAISVNEKLCKDCLKKANTSLDNFVKYMGKSGSKSGTTVVGAIEQLNQGFRDTKEVAQLYKNFSNATVTLAKRLKAVDKGFQAIDKAV